MEMVAAESIGIGEDLTPPLSPIAYALHDSFLPSHCSSCFSPLLPSNSNPIPLHNLRYCSPSCYSSHSPLHLSSSALLQPQPHQQQHTSDLRLALLLLLQIKRHSLFNSYDRIAGLMSNRHNLLSHDHHLSATVTNGAKAISMATNSDSDDYRLEEAVLCAVLTNAVEVQDRNGQSVGIAVYDTSFSWINHSCSPNACYRFVPPEEEAQSDQPRSCHCRITPASSDPSQSIHFSSNSHLLTGYGCGPRLAVRSIKTIKKGEQVTIAYTDLLQPKEARQSELWSEYRFTCCCHRCVAIPLTYVDHRLQETWGSGNRLPNYDLCTEYVDDAINEYFFYNDAESCCKKLEDALLNGFHDEIRLHPQNHMCLRAYMALASAYSSVTGGLNLKFRAAYSLLLALLANDLYLHESSLIASVSNFWMGAGESLVKLGTSLVSPPEVSGRRKQRCTCPLLEANNDNYDDEKFFKCMSEITGRVWKFLADGNGYLEAVTDRVDLRWFDSNDGQCVTVEEREDDVLRLGSHCLLYGRVLCNVSGSCFVHGAGEVNMLHR